MKKIIILIIVMLWATPLWCGEYKSMCELYPKECVKGALGKLGETIESKDGIKYKVIAEAKSTVDPVWVQLIDVGSVNNKLDGRCNFAVAFILKPDGFYGESFSCEEAIGILMRQCITEGIKYEDYVHKAK